MHDVRKLVSASLFASLTVVGALTSLQLPFLTRVPFTLQIFFVLLAGVLLGPGWGAASQMVYLALGAVGLPVFAGAHGGVGVLLGPDGGYLWAFPLAASLSGFLGSRSRGFWPLLGSMLAGLLLIYAGGVLWLAWLLRLSLLQALAVGMFPFAFFDLVKICLAAALAVRVRRALPQLR
ncbi:MAG: biotin transporter BioY [Thermaerobacter sp.]|nr:biotin transporter BioY [Thermaerobacter sp.]